MAAIVLILIVVLTPGKPPDYLIEGKSVSQWALDACAGDAKAAAKIKATGGKAVPNLIWMVRTKDSLWSRNLWKFQSRFPRRMQTVIQQKVPWPQSSRIREAGAFALGVIGPEAERAVPVLVRALRDKEGTVSWKAATALGQIGKASVPALAKSVSDRDTNARCSAAYALGLIGPEAVAAIPALIRGAGDVDERVRGAATYSLWQIGGAGILGLAEATRNGSGRDRQVAMRALEAMDRYSHQSVTSILKDLTRDPSPVIRARAIEALGVTYPSQMMTRATLVACLDDPDREVRLKTIEVLGLMGRKAKPAVNRLNGMTNETDGSLRAAAQVSLRQIAADGGVK